MSNTSKKVIQTDILCVGAGIASLSTALALLRTLKAQGTATLPRVTIVEKGRSVGSHVLSGAVIDPSGFKGLLTDDEFAKMPVEARVSKESFHMFFDAKRSVQIPWVPPLMLAHGYPVGGRRDLHRFCGCRTGLGQQGTCDRRADR